ncbi:MAG: hypothetical protein M1820_007628 [Bogoriella megaspora]|nr:MAG: hypothetical protein M1820_007628 [Bogoriella megaspora]
MDDDWTASHFSPSKARQQRAQAKDWEYVDSWLTKKFTPKPVPPFERNEDTLKALMELASFNEATDEETSLIAEVQESVLKELQDQTKNSANENDVLNLINDSLSKKDQANLSSLAQLSVVLEAPDVKPDTLAERAITFTESEFNVEQQCQRADALIDSLQNELLRLEQIRTQFNNEGFVADSRLGQRTAEWTRGTKQLKAKLVEYNERLSSIPSDFSANPRVEDVNLLEVGLSEVQQRLKVLEREVQDFQGLPHDIDLARLKVADLTRELQELKRERDRRFEGLIKRT